MNNYELLSPQWQCWCKLLQLAFKTYHWMQMLHSQWLVHWLSATQFHNRQEEQKACWTRLTKSHSDDQPPCQENLFARGGAQHNPPHGEEEAGQQYAHPAPEESVEEAAQQGGQGGRGHSTWNEHFLPQGGQLQLPLQQEHRPRDYPGVVAKQEPPQGGEGGQDVDEAGCAILLELLTGGPLQVPGGGSGGGGWWGGWCRRGTGVGSRGGGALTVDAGAGRSLDETPLPSVVHFLPPLAHQVAHTPEIVVMVALLSRHMETQHRTGLQSCIRRSRTTKTKQKHTKLI